MTVCYLKIPNNVITLLARPEASSVPVNTELAIGNEVFVSDGKNWIPKTNVVQTFTITTLPIKLPEGELVFVDDEAVRYLGGRYVRDARRNLPQLISSRNVTHEILTTMSSGTERGYQIWRDVFLQGDVDGIDLTFANLYIAQNGIETDNPSPVTIKVGVYKKNGNYVTPVFFNGKPTHTMAAGEIITSDKVPFKLKAGVDSGFYIRIWVEVPTTSDTIVSSFLQSIKSSQSMESQFNTYRMVGVHSSFVQDLTANNTKELDINEFGPALVRGYPADGGAFPSVVIIGSSSAQGVGDSQTPPYYVRGYLARSLAAAGIPYFNCSESGETAANFLADGAAKRRKLLSLCNATHSINTYGSNDISTGISIDTLKQRLARLKDLMEGLGTTPYFCTYTPVTTSINSWADEAGQTVTSPIRAEINAWLRDSSGYNVIDLEKMSDSGAVAGLAASGKWRTDLGIPTVDGYHGTPLMHEAIAVGISYPNIRF